MRRLTLVVALVLVLAVALPFVGDALFGWKVPASLYPSSGQSVDIGESRHLNVEDEGEGPTTIVLVHGSPSNIGDWTTLPGQLRDRGHRVVVYDRAGYGYSTRIESADGNYTHQSNARDLLALIDVLGIDSATFVGWSFGGGVVQQLAVDAPERVDGLVLLASTGPAVDDAPREHDFLDVVLVSPVAPIVLAWLARVPPLSWETTHASVAEAFSGAHAVPTGWTIRTQAMLALPGTFTTLSREIVASKPDRLAPESIEAPALVMHGSDDRLISHRVAEALASALPSARLVTIPNGSHMLPATHPERLGDEIDAFARTAAAARPGPTP